MEDTNFEDTNELLDKYEKELLPELKEETDMLNVRSDYAETTSFEKQLIRNTQKLNKVLNANHQINKKIIVDYKDINKKLDETNNLVASNIENLASKANDKMDTCFKKCFDESESVAALNKQNTKQLHEDYESTLSRYKDSIIDLSNKLNSYGNEIDNLKKYTISYIKKSLLVAGIVYFAAIVIVSIIACTSSYLVLHLVPEMGKMWSDISGTAWIIFIVVIIAVIVGSIAFIRNKK